jgi:hypothetical protein
VWVLISTSRVPADFDRPAHLIMHIEDISNRKALEAELVHRALHDPLTGLANRRLLVDRIDQALTATDHAARSHACSTWIWTGSSRSTTATGTRPGTRC